MHRFFSLLLVVSLIALSMSAEGRPRRRRRARVKPIPTFRPDGSANIQATSAFAIDDATGGVLFERSSTRVRPIASLSKLTAVLVLIERGLRLDQTSTITQEDRKVARGGARSRLPIGFTFTNDDLLHAALLSSDNRAVSALGRSVGLDVNAFAAAMTEKARSLGLEHTRFADPVGLDYGNVSTAREMIVILRETLAHPLLGSVLRKQAHVAVSVAPVQRAVPYRNTNQLLFRQGLTGLGGKTGYNALAGHCFVGSVRTTTGRQILAAFLGTHGKLTRFGDFGRLLTWVDKLDGERAVAAGDTTSPTNP